jgi:sugar phosphate isomerase/epimerase
MHVQMHWLGRPGRTQMRLRHTSGRIVCLSCEVAPRAVGNLPDLIALLDTFGSARARLGVDALGVSFWLPPALAATLAVDNRTRTRLRAELDARRLDVVTLTGVPFAVSAEDTAPAWTEPARREYTLDLARILLDLLDEDAVRGTVSTVGLGPRAGWAEAEEFAAAGILRRLSAGLADLAWQNGRAIRVGFRPAPGLVLDSPEQIVAGLARTDKDRLGVCLDLGHAARTWPEPAAGIETVTDAGIPIVEVRLAAVPGSTTEPWRAGLRQLFGARPVTEYITLIPRAPEQPVDQIAGDITYLLAELAAVGLAPENEPCAAR